MHQLRVPRTWVGSAVITAGLLAIVLWRTLPGPVPGWAALVAAWLVGTAAVHLLLHNRWMRALDERCRAALAARRSSGPRIAAAPGPVPDAPGPGAASPARPRAAAPTTPRADAAPAGRGPAHATHRPGGRLAAVLPQPRAAQRPEPVTTAPRSVPALPPLRPVGPAPVGPRYHHTGRSARSRPRAGRAAHR